MTAMTQLLETTVAARQAAFSGTAIVACGTRLVPSHAGNRLATVRSGWLNSKRDTKGKQLPQERPELSYPRMPQSLRQSRAIEAKTAI